MYYTRLIENEIEVTLKTSGAILICGPKYCGKSTTCTKFANSKIALSNDQIINSVNIDPSLALVGDAPHLIDEWQKVPDLWNHIKEKCSLSGEFGLYILTGSSTPPNKAKIHHSGAGRIAPIIMKPMSLFESLESNGLISLANLFDNKDVNVQNLNENGSLEAIAHEIVRGGWPQSIRVDKKLQIKVTRNYFNGLFNFHETENEEFKKLRSDILISLLKSCARNISSEASDQTIIKDVLTNGRDSFNVNTFKKYYEALKNLFIIYEMDSWNPNLRSKVAIRSKPILHFYDPSIAAMALNISENGLLKDLNTMGLLFEDLVCRDISIYSMSEGGKLSHYRDANGLECDIVLHLDNGKYALIEVKLGGEKLINEGIASLRKLRDKLDLDKEKTPSLCMVVTAIGPAYKTSDNIYVVPINLLRD